MTELYLSKFDIKIGFLDPKNSEEQIFEHMLVLRNQLYQIFQNTALRAPSSGQNFKSR